MIWGFVTSNLHSGGVCYIEIMIDLHWAQPRLLFTKAFDTLPSIAQVFIACY